MKVDYIVERENWKYEFSSLQHSVSKHAGSLQ